MEIVIIGDEATRTGFKLSGVTRTYPGEEAKTHLTKMLQDDSIGIIMITERYAEENRDVLNRASKDKKRYLPAAAWRNLSKGEIAATNAAKAKGNKRNESSQIAMTTASTDRIAELATKPPRNAPGKRAKKLPRNGPMRAKGASVISR